MRRRLVTLALAIPALLLAVGLGAWAWLWHSQAGAEWLWQKAREGLASSSRSARLDGRLSGSLGGGIRLTGLSYRDADVAAGAERVDLGVGLQFFPVVLTVSRLDLHRVEVEIREGRQAEPASTPAAAGDFRAPLPMLVDSLHIDGAIIRRGDLEIPVDAISAHGQWRDRLSLEVTAIEAPLVSGTLSLGAALTPPYPLESEVRVSRLTLPEETRQSLPWLPEALDAALEITGDRRALDVGGTLEWPEWLPEATVRGRVDQPFSAPAWSLQALADEVLVPAALLGERLQQAALAAGSAPAIRDLDLRASGAGTDLEITAGGSLRSPWTAAAGLTFEGSVAGGQLSGWSLSGQADVQAEGWPAGRVDFTAAGSEEGLSASVTAPELFGGSLAVSAETRAGEGRPWHAELTASDVATTALLEVISPHLEAGREPRLEEINRAVQAETFSAHVLASGRLEPLEITADIQRLGARLRGRGVTAAGRLQYGDGGLSARGLTLRSGASSVVLDGSPRGPLELRVEITSLGDLLPDSSGSLAGRIQYLNDGEEGIAGSRLRADLVGRAIRAFDWFVEDLQISAPQGDDAPLAVALKASDVTGPVGTLSDVSAAFSGDFERHTLSVVAELDGSRGAASLSGGFAQGVSGAWKGSLETLELHPAAEPAWTLRAPAPVRFEPSLALETACLTPGGEPELCFGIEHGRDGRQEGRLEMTSVSLAFIARLAEWPLTFSQRLSGTLSWALSPGQKPSARADFEVSEGAIIDTADNRELLHTGAGVFAFEMDRGRLHSGDLDIPLDSGLVDLDFSVPDVLAGEASELRGSIRVDLDDLDPIANFIPQLVQTDGELKADLTVGGIAGSPRLDGTIELHNGRTQVLAPGLRLSEIELTGRLDNANHVRVDGSFLAGNGRGEVRADVDLSDPLQPVLDVHIKGEALTLVEVPDLQLEADTDLTANWRDDVLRLAGRIHVPKARFAPRYLPSDNALESPDAVIVAGGEHLQNAQPEAQRDIRIEGELDISIGDKVVVDLDIAKASMTGQAVFRWDGPPVPVASGQYDLKGQIQAYGQTLEITRASVRFPNVPADNPHLDIRAERRIYGNSLISHAGVLVHGTLKRPLTEPYTVPMTNADRARALLITGSDFNYEQGTGAVNVGTYISPKLYLSYGVGLFEEGNVITVRYDLKRNFGIKATSGQDDTGIDISYTIER